MSFLTSEISAGDQALASQYNNLRSDMIASMTPQYISGTSIGSYSDNYSYFPQLLTSVIYLRRGISREFYRSGNEQKITYTSIWGTATAIRKAISIIGGYIYVSLRDGSSTRIYRASITSDISNSGNWTQMTISGATLSFYESIVGYSNGFFWTADRNNLRKYTISGTTLTFVSTVAVTGANFHEEITCVNENGIYAGFASTPYIRKADLTGTLSNESYSTNNPITFSNQYGFYLADDSLDGYELFDSTKI